MNDGVLSALVQVLTPTALRMMVIGVVVGYAIGIRPGLGAQ